MFERDAKRITAIVGHYGSGKTEIAINYALYLNRLSKNVVVADLDTVNPYFRTKSVEKLFENRGIGLIAPEFANTNVDLPSLPPEVYGLFDRNDIYGILDIGGDDEGATVLGAYHDRIINIDYDLL